MAVDLAFTRSDTGNLQDINASEGRMDRRDRQHNSHFMVGALLPRCTCDVQRFGRPAFANLLSESPWA